MTSHFKALENPSYDSEKAKKAQMTSKITYDGTSYLPYWMATEEEAEWRAYYTRAGTSTNSNSSKSNSNSNRSSLLSASSS